MSDKWLTDDGQKFIPPADPYLGLEARDLTRRQRLGLTGALLNAISRIARGTPDHRIGPGRRSVLTLHRKMARNFWRNIARGKAGRYNWN